MSLPLLPTTVVGSYSMPGWLERLKTEYFARRISRVDLDEIHDSAVKAARPKPSRPPLSRERDMNSRTFIDRQDRWTKIWRCAATTTP